MDHISVCVCTYKRPDMLAQLLQALACQQSSDAFTYSIVVIDNDATGSASEVVKAFQDETSIRVHYSIEAVRGIPVARNRSEERRVGKECRSRWSPYH